MHYVFFVLLFSTFYYPILNIEVIRLIYLFLSIIYVKKDRLCYSFSNFFIILFITTGICILIHDILPRVLDLFFSINANSFFEIPITCVNYIPHKKLYSIGGVIVTMNVIIVLFWISIVHCLYHLPLLDLYNLEKLEYVLFCKVFYCGAVVSSLVLIFLNCLYLGYNQEVYSYFFIRDIYLSIRYEFYINPFGYFKGG